MGGDLGPSEVVEGLAAALKELPDLSEVILVGDEAVLNPLLAEKGLKGDPRVSVLHASEVVGMDDKPIAALKQKKDSSMVRALELVKEGRAKLVLSCGNTGALMAGGTIKLRPMPGVERPALASVLPRPSGPFILIDAGANPEATPEHLVHNAVLGSVYARAVLGIQNPRVGLLTIGTEEGKGTEKINATHSLLKKLEGLINYTGPVEGFQLFEDHVDVVVCDGFTGNVLLKGLESVFHMLKSFMTRELKRTPVRVLGAVLSMGAYRQLKKEISPERHGGAPLLGLRGLVLKAHGSSNRNHIRNAIRIGLGAVRADISELAQADIARANDLIRAGAAPEAARQ